LQHVKFVVILLLVIIITDESFNHCHIAASNYWVLIPSSTHHRYLSHFFIVFCNAMQAAATASNELQQ